MTRRVSIARTPSRESHEERHWVRARCARSGWPRCRVEARSPPTARMYARAKKANAVQPVTEGRPSPRKARSPKPRPESTVKAMIEGAGCMGQRLRVEERGKDVELGRRRVAGPRRQVLVDGFRALFGHEIDPAPGGGEFRDAALGVVVVAEVARTRGAGPHAGGNTVNLGDLLVVDAVHAEGAFLHDALGRVHLARTVGAGPGAEPAADAGALVDKDDTVLRALVGGARGADGDTRRVVAVEAGFREVDELGGARLGGDLIGMDAVEKGTRGVGSVWVRVGERGAVVLGIPALAGGDTCVTADTGVEVDCEAEAFFCLCWQAGHSGLIRLP